MVSVFKLRLKDTVDSAFNEFFEAIATKFDLNVARVRHTCLAKPVKPLSKERSKLLEEAKEFITTEIPSMKMTVDKLKALCKAQGLKVSGKKEELLTRITNPNAEESKGKKGGKRKVKSLFKGRDVTEVISKLKGPVSTLAIRKNAEGFYVHVDSGLVFDPHSSKVIGKWHTDRVKWLTSEDIQKCIELKVSYEIPENLDIGISKVADQKVTDELGPDDFKDEPDIDTDEEENDDD